MQCLRAQSDQLRVFLDLLAQQRDALARRDTDALTHLTAEQERAVARSRRLEQERRDLTAQLAGCNGRAPDDPQLADLVEASEASELAHVQDQLRDLHGEVERRSRLNATLIEQSMRCTGETLQWIARSAGPRPVYDRKGETTESGQLAVDRIG